MPPPCQPFGLPFDPPGAPLRGSPGHSGRLPLPSLFGNGKGWASEARRGGSPGEGLKKIKVAAPIAAAGRRQWKCGEGRAAGGQGWGQPVGNPPGCPRGVPASVHGPRSAGRSRSDLHISTARGSRSAPSGGLFCPAGLTTSVPGLGLLPGNVMRGHPRTPVRASHTTQLTLTAGNPHAMRVLSWRHRKNKVATPKGQNARKAAPALAGTL